MSNPGTARLLAPLALVVCAIALLLVLTTGGGDDTASSNGPAATATPTPTATARPARTPSPASSKTYTVKSGDSPSSIAAAEGVSVEDLLAANPDADPTTLSVGDELKIPSG